MKQSQFKILAVIAVIFVGIAAFAQEEAQKAAPSANDLAEKLNNPTAAIGSMNTFIDFKTYGGSLPDAGSQTGFSLTFQPSLPKPLGKGINLLIRPAIPVIFSQPVYNGEDGFENSGVQLGNIGFDLAIGTTTKGGLLIMGGLVGGLPTATSQDIRGQFTLGPELALGYVSKKAIVGALITQSWDLSNDPLQKTNVLGGQYFYFFPIGKGRTIGASPLYSYNWDTNELMFPVGIGYSAVTAFGTLPFKYGLFVFYNVVQPDLFGQVWQIRLQLTPVVKLPWK